jgi:hypothetical protein
MKGDLDEALVSLYQGAKKFDPDFAFGLGVGYIAGWLLTWKILLVAVGILLLFAYYHFLVDK